MSMICAGFILAHEGKFFISEINDLKLLVCCAFQLPRFLIQHALSSACRFVAWRSVHGVPYSGPSFAWDFLL